MEDGDSTQGSQRALGALVKRLSNHVAGAIRYWETRRAIYNLVLAVVVLGHFVVGLPDSWSVLSIDLVLGLFFLAVLANIAYCAAYIVDFFLQFSGLQSVLSRGRVVVLVVGTAFAGVIARFFSAGMFGWE